MDVNGNAIALWQEDDVKAKSYTVAGGWGATTVLGLGGGGDFSQIAMDANGNGIAVWSQWDGVHGTIMTSRFTP